MERKPPIMLIFAIFLTFSISSIFSATSMNYSRIVAIQSPGEYSNYDILVNFDTASEIQAGKLRPDCRDIEFLSSDEASVLSHWLEGGCNTTNTSIWVTVPQVAVGNMTTLMKYGNSSFAAGGQDWGGTFIAMSNASCPAGWARFSALDGKFPIGNSTYGATGGTSSYSHSYSFNSGGPTGGTTLVNPITSTKASTSHTHSISGTVTTATPPPYLEVVFCSTPNLAASPSMVSMFNSNSIPQGWARFSALDGRLPIGNSVYGGVGGSSSHTHEWSGTTGGSSGTAPCASGTGRTGSAVGHAHAYTSASSSSGSSMPPYESIVFMQADSQGLPTPGMILIANSTPPKGWTRVSSMDSRFPLGNASYGSMGGADNHSHTVSVSGFPAASSTVISGSASSGSVAISSHQHSSGSGPMSSTSNTPPYLGVLFFERNAPAATAQLLDANPRVSPNFPANNAIQNPQYDVALNWTPFNFASDPTCNLSSNSTIFYSGVCTNNQPCIAINTTDIGSYSWNVTCYTVNETATSQTRNFTIASISATGGTATTTLDGGINYSVHTFTSNGTFTVVAPIDIEVLVVAGGGAGGTYYGGGGGGGGVIYQPSYAVSLGIYPVVVGAGGIGAIPTNYTSTIGNGGNSVFGALVAIGGGKGSAGGGAPNNPGSGGSGGGGGTTNGWVTCVPGGNGTLGQGYAGGCGWYSGNYPTGGGGGAGGVGLSPFNASAIGGNGGPGIQMNGAGAYYGGGGGGGSIADVSTGGLGGGGNKNTSGSPNTGGGGGGAAASDNGPDGGSGIVIIRYLTQGVAPPTLASNFSTNHGSTNFSAVMDLGNITNLTLATPKGKIKFAENHVVNATGQDYDSKVVIGNGFISVNSSGLNPSFNSSATLTISNVSCPATVYYASGFFNSSDAVLAEKNICNSTTDPSCTGIICSEGNLTFTVSHFTGFAYAASANLTVWDETDSGMPNGNQMKYIGQNIRFFTNYSNSSSEPITGADCQIWFSDSNWSAMSWNSTNLYEYARAFNSGGTFNWNVSCNKTGQATLDANDSVIVNSTIAVVLGAPADNAIVKSSAIIYNWSAYGFPADPACNLTRNGSVVYSATCTNNALCGYTNTTANGAYVWNVTCYSGAIARTSSTRALTVNTLYHSTNVEGMLNMNITQITSISLPQNSISFGAVEITQTYDSYPDQFFVIKNDGNVPVDVEVNATNPFLGSNCTSLPCAAYQVKVGANETIPYPICPGNPSKETYANMFGSSPGLLINDLNFVDNDDSANIYIKFRLPNDEPPGSKSSIVTFWAKSAGSYSCN